jgi:hypothetical protein
LVDTFEIIEFNKADKFLEALRPSHPRWLSDGPPYSTWIFRGQGSGDWTLTPSAWRHSVCDSPFFKLAVKLTEDLTDDMQAWSRDWNHLSEEDYRHRSRDIEIQKLFEINQVIAFLELADRIGIDLPSGSVFSRLTLPDFSQQPHPAFALAQHHGIPTRLLDWTLSPIYASFFASESPAETNGSMAVWALSTRFFLRVSRSCQDNGGWQLFRVPRSLIKYVHAQAGLFVYNITPEGIFLSNGEWPSIEKNTSEEVLKKLTLPSSEAPELRRLLFAEGVSRAHLMPSLDNVRTTLGQMSREQMLRFKWADESF